MATITSFENMPDASQEELKEFEKLFTELFYSSSEEAKRQAVAALSRCPNVPEKVSFFIGSQPISIAAIFLTRSQAISDKTLITIAQTQGFEYIQAITHRNNLSSNVKKTLISLQQRMLFSLNLEKFNAKNIFLDEKNKKIDADNIGKQLLQISKHLTKNPESQKNSACLSPIHEALLVRFARSGEKQAFSRVLADTLMSTISLAKKILSRNSGYQFAITLRALQMNISQATFILEKFYPQLAENNKGISRAKEILEELKPEECAIILNTWRINEQNMHQVIPTNNKTYEDNLTLTNASSF
ncbi:hypothetical protein B488_02510 [Liberibacter crescens BT-1]|uniref:DUF2336 domain-containing protein n=2 Tax=Liberibacter crescens TaxID=1273132 RepID=L0ERW8_LIBCB|nr:hypothetical protein B488_02510 [Liberibacter crescens BT-1]